ncbi:hypothetical protein [Gimesia aquarii]|uniref:Uncharacterized protein n=1 Tax=Gimesia aquarii TaxID=2527964 RepID=A0A517W3Q7_9PLAN|nr:hypothetical protein [Gimesia aquarii]QDT99887.1 hypothetical protein V144x_54010 [Gimesia aquarii]
MIDVPAERESLLKDLHPIFREVDIAVAAYIDIVRDSPELSDEQIQDQLISKGVESSLAFGCTTFVPTAFGRTIIHELGVSVSDTYIEFNLSNKQEVEKQLTEQFEFIWAKTVVSIYRESSEYSSVCKTISLRSAEVAAINNALHDGETEESLREGHLGPSIVIVGKPQKRWWEFWRK